MSKPPTERADKHLWSWSLTLEDPKDATEYRLLREQRISRTGGHVHTLCLVIGIMGLVTNQFFRDTPRAVQLACAVGNVVLPAIPAYMSLKRRQEFTQWYDCIVILNQAAVALLAVFSVGYLDSMEGQSSRGALNAMFFYSPLAVLFTMTVVHRTTFRGHFIGQVFVAVVSHGWVYSLRLRQELLQPMDAIGWSLETLFSGVGLFHLSGDQLSRSDTPFPPWMVAGFFHFAVGLVIPCVVKYVMECYSLAKYLTQKYHEDAHRMIWTHFFDGVVFAGFAGMTSMLGGWIVLRGFAI
ncbi:hypothetical protein BSKO_06296 [Bryopsis sp. KO-2023]|nr:hypothetical protein BSKO_06296 [Bryopsis sp. KO-2023]